MPNRMTEEITVRLSRPEAEALDAHLGTEASRVIGRHAESWPPWAKLRSALASQPEITYSPNPRDTLGDEERAAHEAEMKAISDYHRRPEQ